MENGNVKASIIGFGIKGYEALLYFERHYINIPNCALFLSARKREKIKDNPEYIQSEILGDNNVLELDQDEGSFSQETIAILDILSSKSNLHIIVDLSGSFSVEYILGFIDFIKQKAVNIVVFGLMPFKLEGVRKRNAATKYLSILQNQGVDCITIESGDLLNQSGRKITLKDAFDILFELMAKKLRLQSKPQKQKEWKKYMKQWMTDVLKIGFGVALGGILFLLFIFLFSHTVNYLPYIGD